ncbi:MAG: VacJ family lipoprotein [Rhodobacteraceae bacterium]|nr:VacJ family lipoprotein [Paracoccaceae bacterium]
MTAKANIFNWMIRGALLASLGACASGQTHISEGEIYDPFEEANRSIHEFNIALDTLVVGPVASVYGAVVPEDIRTVVENAARNLSEPNAFINHVLQGDGDAAGTTLLRFALNSTLGIAGLADPAADMGLFQHPTDFGETLGTWGLPEGAYIELPILGPSTVRDTVGILVDLAIDPLNYVITREQAYYMLALKGVNLIGKRNTYDDLISLLLYESADSYAAQRLSYMQNKRYAVSGGQTEIEDLEDPYAFQ